VEAQPSVRAVAPQRGDAAMAFQEHVRDAPHGEARRHRQPRRPCAHDHRSRQHLPVLAHGEARGRRPRCAPRAVQRVVRPLALRLGEAVHDRSRRPPASRQSNSRALAICPRDQHSRKLDRWHYYYYYYYYYMYIYISA